MGIRFEYGARKATNGPLIFFSDPVSELNLMEEIRGAIESRLCFYAYRMPGDTMVSFGSSEGTVEGIGCPGFVVAPFLPGMSALTIPYSPAHRDIKNESFPFPDKSTDKEHYVSEIAEIQKQIDLQDDKKIVAARVVVENGSVDVAATFLKLSAAYPDAYVFCFSTPETGCWLGATPELLLKSHNDSISTMALAGTRLAGIPGAWDKKNIIEQKIVKDYIVDAMKKTGLQVMTEPTITRNAGNVEHLCTPIRARISPESSLNLHSLLTLLSPTPATAGLPRTEAIDLIERCESFQRAYYGGYCGPFRNEKEFSLFVILRCARIEKERYALFAGGGITADSDPDKEWEETDMKLSTLKQFLIREAGNMM